MDIEKIIKEKDFMLTTLDNPYNPYHDFDKWYEFDETSGYHTSEYIARVLVSSDDLSEEDQDEAVRIAMEEILTFNLSGKHTKVYEDSIIKI